jgi:hypothetical protein
VIKKQIEIKIIKTEFDNKIKKNQMTKDKIKNKTQLEIINVNKTITNKRRGTELKKGIK